MAESAKPLPESFSVGRWSADGNALSLTDGETVQHLEPRAFGVLRYLAERPQRLVTIDELMDALWPDVVVTPNAVTRVIAQLRKALGDEAKNPQYIQTVARTGYRLLAPVGSGDEPRTRWSGFAIAGLVGAALALSVIFWPEQEPPPTPSVAVLPFENFTGDAALDYLGEGVAEEVINSLAQIPELQVSARSLSFAFRDSGTEARDFARDLGVSYLVEGSVRQSGQELRITAQLINAGSGFHVWSRTTERAVLELFQAQDQISTGIALALVDELGLVTPVSRHASRPAPDPEAYNLYLRGRYVWHRRGSEPLQPAIDRFAEAVKIDADFAKGWAALASAYLTYPSYSPEGYATWHNAEDAARKARELDPSIPEVYGVLGTFAQVRLNWVEAHELVAEGVRRGERSATAHYWYSEHLAKTGRFIDSLRHLDRALRLDPTYEVPRVDAAFAQLFFGRHEVGAEQFAALWDSGFRDPTSWTGNFIGRMITGDYSGAREVVDAGPFPDTHKALLHRYVDVEAGLGDRARLVSDLFGGAVSIDHRLLTWVGSRLEAYDAVIAMLRERLRREQFVETRPLWGPSTRLREQPEFLELIEELGILDYWNAVAWGSVCRQHGSSIVCDAAGMTPDVAMNILGAAE